MFFFLSKALWILVKPSNLLVLGAIVAALGRLRKLLFVCLLFILAAGFTPLPQWLMAPLENRFPQAGAILNPPDGIIVLGGAFRPALSDARGQSQVNTHGERLTTAAALAIKYPNAKLVFSGGTWGFYKDNGEPARLARGYFESLGLPLQNLILEGKSRNTRENIAFSKALVSPQAGERWLLVTSAFHMPRSVGLFRKAGWPVTPYPVDYASFPLADRFQVTWSVSRGLSMVDDAVHEYVGLAAYFLTGRIDELFPAP